MKNIPILGKFLTIIAVFGMFAAGVTLYTTGQMRQIDDAYSAMNDHESAATVLITRVNSRMNTARAAIAELMIADTDAANKEARQAFDAARGEFEKFSDEAASLVPAQAQAIENLKSRGLGVLDHDCAESMRLGMLAQDPAAVLASQKVYFLQCASKFPSIIADLKVQSTELRDDLRAKNDLTTAKTNAAITLTYGVILGGLVVVTVLALIATGAWITGPLGALNRTMERLADGDLDAMVTGADRRDEVGRMARTVQVFKNSGLDKVRIERDADAQRVAVDAERRGAEAAQAEAARELALVVEQLGGGLAKLSDGDLTYRLTQSFAQHYKKLQDDFNAALATLQDTMTVINGNTTGIKAGTGEITQASDDLSRRTEQQAASLEETAAALDEITATVRKTAAGAIHARNVVSAAKADADQSGTVVAEAVAAMGKIEHSAKKITNIIGVIDEIAFQTNLLALNAGVEAARAGDAGRGFAVVASEVRALAQRSAEAAKEIKALISTSTTQVAAGVGLVGETGKALRRIGGRISDITGVISEIAASAQAQASGLHQVNTAVNQMDHVIQQNAAMVEESTAACHSLAKEADNLSRLIGQFQVGGSTAGLARPVGRPAASPVGRLPYAPRAKIVALAGAGRRAAQQA